jgi:beta-1,4-N-acetylglucosaminyltransferase
VLNGIGYLNTSFCNRVEKALRMSAAGEKTVFITVGTTEFDELIRVIDTPQFLETVIACGFARLVIQHGRGDYIPTLLDGSDPQLSIEMYRFKPTLDEDMARADLIISHCGAGSILEAVRHEKELIVVVNNTLQGNHQTELADAMSEAGHCISTDPAGLISVLHSRYSNRTVKKRGPTHKSTENIPITNPNHFAKAIADMYEFSM